MSPYDIESLRCSQTFYYVASLTRSSIIDAFTSQQEGFTPETQWTVDDAVMHGHRGASDSISIC